MPQRSPLVNDFSPIARSRCFSLARTLGGSLVRRQRVLAACLDPDPRFFWTVDRDFAWRWDALEGVPVRKLACPVDPGTELVGPCAHGLVFLRGDQQFLLPFEPVGTLTPFDRLPAPMLHGPSRFVVQTDVRDRRVIVRDLHETGARSRVMTFAAGTRWAFLADGEHVVCAEPESGEGLPRRWRVLSCVRSGWLDRGARVVAEGRANAGIIAFVARNGGARMFTHHADRRGDHTALWTSWEIDLPSGVVREVPFMASGAFAREGAAVSASPDGAFVAVQTVDANGVQWRWIEGETGRLRKSIAVAEVCAQLLIAPDARWIAGVQPHHAPVVYDTSTFQRVAVGEGHVGSVLSVHWLDAQQWLLSVGRGDPIARVWDAHTGACAESFELSADVVHAEVAPDRRRVFVLRDGTYHGAQSVDVHELPSGERLARHALSHKHARMSVTPEGEEIVWVQLSRTPSVWSWRHRAGSAVRSARLDLERSDFGSDLVSVRVSYDGRWVYGLETGGRVFCASRADGAIAWQDRLDVDGRGAWIPGTDVLVYGTLDARVACRDFAERVTRWVVPLLSEPLAVTPDGARCVVRAGQDLIVLDTVRGVREDTVPFSRVDESPCCAAFSHDGSRLAVGTREGMLFVFVCER